jgi:hypothetical protein
MLCTPAAFGHTLPSGFVTLSVQLLHYSRGFVCSRATLTHSSRCMQCNLHAEHTPGNLEAHLRASAGKARCGRYLISCSGQPCMPRRWAFSILLMGRHCILTPICLRTFVELWTRCEAFLCDCVNC